MALVLIIALVSSFAAFSASAYTAVNGDNTLNFNQFLVVEENAKIPAITFTYSVAPRTAVDATATTPAIIAGVGTPVIGSAAFANGDTTYSTVQTNDSVTLDTGEKYAKKTVNVDFSSVSFSQPGVYRYVITAVTNADNKAVSYDTQVGTGGTARTRCLDVYVVDDNSVLKVNQYVLHDTSAVIASTATSPAADKSTGFVNEVKSHEITFGKEVTGNQGSKNKYFKFTLTINNAQASTTYEVDLTKAEASPTATDATTYTGMTNPASVTTGSHGVVTEYFYLKDGQYITIKGLPEGCMYELSEIAEDYTSSNGITAANNAGNKAHTDAVINTTGVTADIFTGFTNDRSDTVPTGVLLTVAPFAIGLLLFGAVGVTMLARKKEEE